MYDIDSTLAMLEYREIKMRPNFYTVVCNAYAALGVHEKAKHVCVVFLFFFKPFFFVEVTVIFLFLLLRRSFLLFSFLFATCTRHLACTKTVEPL